MQELIIKCFKLLSNVLLLLLVDKYFRWLLTAANLPCLLPRSLPLCDTVHNVWEPPV